MKNENNFTNTLINWVDSRPIYFGIGLILIIYAAETAIVQKLIAKFTKKEETTDSQKPQV